MPRDADHHLLDRQPHARRRDGDQLAPHLPGGNDDGLRTGDRYLGRPVEYLLLYRHGACLRRAARLHPGLLEEPPQRLAVLLDHADGGIGLHRRGR